MECQCKTCKQACEKRPGWFRPGEAEKAAELLGMTLQEFFDEHLCVDYWWGNPEEGEENVYVLAPATVDSQPGDMYPANCNAKCVLYQDGLCKIHAAKPAECAYYHHDLSGEDGNEHRNSIRDEWREHQNQIRELLGREPELPIPTIADACNLMGIPELGALAQMMGLGNKLVTELDEPRPREAAKSLLQRAKEALK